MSYAMHNIKECIVFCSFNLALYKKGLFVVFHIRGKPREQQEGPNIIQERVIIMCLRPFSID